MATNITSLPPATAPIPHDGGEPDMANGAGEMEFSEIWADRKGPTFFDFLDIINPLQHIPFINTIYRDLTGDEIGFAARLIGGALFGGPIGFGGAVISMAAEEAMGEEPAKSAIVALRNLISPSDGAAPSAGPELAVLPEAAQVGAGNPLTASSQNPPQPTAPHAAAPAAVPVQAPAAPTTSFPAHPGAISVPGSAPPPAPRKIPEQIAALSDRASESARISRKILEAQRAQAGILLASIGMSPQELGIKSQSEDDGNNGGDASRPRSPHPYALPAGASPEWIKRAMGQGLEKYRQTIRLRGTAAALPLPTR